jgi:chitin disaccharide deacetylase
MTRTLALCADDFGLNPGICAGIAQLAHAQRLTAVSCITNSRHWLTHAELLKNLPSSVQLGLHLNFTEGRPLSSRLAKHWPQLPQLSRLIVQAHFNLLPRPEVRNEVHSQLSAFSRVLDASPSFIDGHQHVHHLPVLRDIILDMAEHVQPLPAVRNTAHVLGPGFGVKRWLIQNTGGRMLAQQLNARALAHNPVLLGTYDFTTTDYRGLMQCWLAELPTQGGLLFCHPGTSTDGGADARHRLDPISAARARELIYLTSDAFDNDLAAADVKLGHVWRANVA